LHPRTARRRSRVRVRTVPTSGHAGTGGSPGGSGRGPLPAQPTRSARARPATGTLLHRDAPRRWTPAPDAPWWDGLMVDEVSTRVVVTATAGPLSVTTAEAVRDL